MFKIPEPTSNCKIIEAITIGPTPKEIMLPNSVPKIIAKNSNLSRALFESPKRGIFARIKKAAKTIRVHFSFILNPSFFSSGLVTSGI